MCCLKLLVAFGLRGYQLTEQTEYHSEDRTPIMQIFAFF